MAGRNQDQSFLHEADDSNSVSLSKECCRASLASSKENKPVTLTRMLILLLSNLFLAGVWADELQNQLNDLLSHPQISHRCKNLIHERQGKILTLERNKDLITRSQKLTTDQGNKRQMTKAQLQATIDRLTSELAKNQQQLTKHDELMVRSGCPLVRL